MRVFDIARPDERDHITALAVDEQRDRWEVDPDEMYPAAIEYARSLLEPNADVPMYLRQHVDGLREVVGSSKTIWGHALQPASDLTPSQRSDRAQVLEFARLIFTALLREQNGAPIGLHITRNDAWRL
jgi:hypothetical protein